MQSRASTNHRQSEEHQGSSVVHCRGTHQRVHFCEIERFLREDTGIRFSQLPAALFVFCGHADGFPVRANAGEGSTQTRPPEFQVVARRVRAAVPLSGCFVWQHPLDQTTTATCPHLPSTSHHHVPDRGPQDSQSCAFRTRARVCAGFGQSVLPPFARTTEHSLSACICQLSKVPLVLEGEGLREIHPVSFLEYLVPLCVILRV